MSTSTFSTDIRGGSRGSRTLEPAMTYAVAGVVRQGKRWHSRVESAKAETSTHLSASANVPLPGSQPWRSVPSRPAHRPRGAPMSVLSELTDALTSGRVEIVDLTARLTAETPVIALPPEFGQTQPFVLEEISRYDDRGPAWYWNNFRSGEHTGTHLDAPNHWVTGRDGSDVADIPPVPADPAGGGARLQRRVRRGRRLPARGRPRPGLGVRARPAARRRLDDLPHRLGRPVGQPGAVHQRERDRAAHARHEHRVRPLGRRGGSRRGGRRGDGGHRRGRRPLLRPALPLPLLPDGQRQVRPHPAPERRAPARPPGPCSSSVRCRS